jgi:hypothetical protein
MIPVSLRGWREGSMRGSDLRTGKLFSYVDIEEPMVRGVKKLGFKFIWTMAAYDLIKLPKLIGAVT